MAKKIVFFKDERGEDTAVVADKVTHLTAGLPIQWRGSQMMKTTCIHFVNDRFVRVQGDVESTAQELRKAHL